MFLVPYTQNIYKEYSTLSKNILEIAMIIVMFFIHLLRDYHMLLFLTTWLSILYTTQRDGHLDLIESFS